MVLSYYKSNKIGGRKMNCRNCGAVMAPTDMFCMSCGTPVAQPEVQAPQPAPVPVPQPAPEQINQPAVQPVPAPQPAPEQMNQAVAQPMPQVPQMGQPMNIQQPTPMGGQPMMPPQHPIGGQMPGMNFNMQAGVPPKKSKLPIIIAVVILAVAVAFAGWYFFLREEEEPASGGKSNTNTSENSNTNTSNTNANKPGTVTYDDITYNIPNGYEYEEDYDGFLVYKDGEDWGIYVSSVYGMTSDVSEASIKENLEADGTIVEKIETKKMHGKEFIVVHMQGDSYKGIAMYYVLDSRNVVVGVVMDDYGEIYLNDKVDLAASIMASASN